MTVASAFKRIKGWLADEKAVAVSAIWIDEDEQYVDGPVWTPIADVETAHRFWFIWAPPFGDRLHFFEAHQASRGGRIAGGGLELRGPEADGIPAMRLLVRPATRAERKEVAGWLDAAEREQALAALAGAKAEASTRKTKPPKEKPKKTFSYAPRYAAENGDWRLTGVYAAGEGEILFKGADDEVVLEDEENGRVQAAVTEGDYSADQVMEYLWTDGSNGVTISVARPEPVRARTLEQAATIALGLVSKSVPRE